MQLRAAVTRERLLDAAAECLVEGGLAGATTTAVAQRSGMSHGALFKHFATKSEMLAAAVEAILRDLVAQFRRDVPPLLAVAGADPIHVACTVLWRIFRRPEMRAVFEVYVAARTDGELARRLAPILDEHRRHIMWAARDLFPMLSGKPDFESAVDAVVYAMQGAAIGLFAPDPDTEVEHLAFLERLARREMARLI